ncbi:hypothetical protein T3H00_01870 [Pseudomonas fluorescens]|uniref:hypothetical protein n=1 Tax=Pseudomonas fluorescens TaxID=294 RepID=UPI002ACA7001|nr:hypothetical protein [Pseudomonas fluorescens]MDZ5431414.1 hypothetical protein [Pseudomonas fluorescens]
MTDFKKPMSLSDAVASFLRKLQKDFAIAPSPTIQELKVRYWYESLRLTAGLERPSELQAMFEPDAIYRDDKGVILATKNKWSGYRRGKHKPRQALLDKIELIAPGSTRAMHHPLWSALDMTDNKLLVGDSFLRTLLPEIQSLVLKPHDQIIASADRLPLSKRRIEQMLRRTNLDTLACLIWLLRQAHATNSANKELIFNGLHKTLVLLGAELHALNIAVPLIQRIIEEVLPLGVTDHFKKLDMTTDDYLSASFVLDVITDQNFRRLGRTSNWKAHSNYMLESLNGDRGLDIMAAMAPRFGLIEGHNSTSTEEANSLEFDLAFRAEAWEHLLHGSSRYSWGVKKVDEHYRFDDS